LFDTAWASADPVSSFVEVEMAVVVVVGVVSVVLLVVVVTSGGGGGGDDGGGIYLYTLSLPCVPHTLIDSYTKHYIKNALQSFKN
jgi:hypothetical protein